jgi:fatty-acyl-CoA synthase
MTAGTSGPSRSSRCGQARPGEAASATELRQFVAAAVAKWQVPERWAFLPEVPKTSVGKFDKKLLRTRYAEGRLDIAEAAGPSPP